MEKYLKRIYYNSSSPSFLAGINNLYRIAKKKYPKITIKKIEKFLSKQDVYTRHKPYYKYQPAKIIAQTKIRRLSVFHC